MEHLPSCATPWTWLSRHVDLRPGLLFHSDHGSQGVRRINFRGLRASITSSRAALDPRAVFGTTPSGKGFVRDVPNSG